MLLDERGTLMIWIALERGFGMRRSTSLSAAMILAIIATCASPEILAWTGRHALGTAVAQGADTTDRQRRSNIEPLEGFEKSSAFRDFGLPVGRLQIDFGAGGSSTCTAFVLSELFIMTNSHCVPGDFNGSELVGVFIESPRAIAATLTMGLIADQDQVPEEFEVDVVPVETSRIFDFSVLAVRGNPSERWGTVELSLAEINEGEAGIVIHSPGGRSLHVTRRDCFLLNSASYADLVDLLLSRHAEAREITHAVRFQTSCSVEPGSSGAPFLSADTGHVVGLISSLNDGPGRSQAIPMRLIATASQIIRDIALAKASSADADKQDGSSDDATEPPMDEPEAPTQDAPSEIEDQPEPTEEPDTPTNEPEAPAEESEAPTEESDAITDEPEPSPEGLPSSPEDPQT